MLAVEFVSTMAEGGTWKARTRVALVGVGLDGITALGELQLRLGDDLVECESTAAKDLAGVAMAMKKLDCSLKISAVRAYQRMCLAWSAESSTVQVVEPQWHFPLYVVMFLVVYGVVFGKLCEERYFYRLFDVSWGELSCLKYFQRGCAVAA